MKRAKIIIALLLATMTGIAVEAQTLSEMFSRYFENQRKVNTFFGVGEFTTTLFDATEKVIYTNTNEIQMYMQHPDSFKIVLNGAQRIEMLQRGNMITQTVPGTDTKITQEVTEHNNLFQKYFGYYSQEQVVADNTMVKSVERVVQDGRYYTRFKIQVRPQQGAGAMNGIQVEEIDYYFDDNSLLAQTCVYSGGKELARTRNSYQLKDDIYVADEIYTETRTQEGIRISSVIKYSAISVNSYISPREFQL
jgi:outer membrane lipoprotein-sorting protein